MSALLTRPEETEPIKTERAPPMPREPVRTRDAPRSWTSAEIVRQTPLEALDRLARRVQAGGLRARHALLRRLGGLVGEGLVERLHDLPHLPAGQRLDGTAVAVLGLVDVHDERRAAGQQAARHVDRGVGRG